MCKTRGGRTSERDKIGKKRWTSDAKKRKKGRNMILFTSCEGPSLNRVWQFPIDSQQTIIIWRETNVSRRTGMCLNIIFNLYIACVKNMCISSGIYIPSKKRNAPLKHSSITFNRLNAKLCKFHISYINQSCIDAMKVIWIFIITVAYFSA